MRNRVGRHGIQRWAGLAIALAAPARPALAQTESVEEPMGDHSGANVPLVTASAAPDYVVPDFPPRKPPNPDAGFTFRPTLVLIGDWTAFGQDAANIAQVGVQEDQFQLRSMRLVFAGTIGRSYKISYQLGGEYKGFDTDPDTSWQLTDMTLTFPIGARTKLSVGHTKETFSYEMVGDAANLPQSERVLNPFFVSRNFGARLTHVFGADKRGTLAIGAYNDGADINSSSSRGWDITARATALVLDDPARHRFWHLGLAYRHVAADGTTRYRGRAETNVGDYFVDTGDFPAESADHFGLESLLNIGPFSLLGEYVTARVNAPSLDDPHFKGWYVTASWVLTGETRPYDRNVGYARRVIPAGRWGTPELVVRLSRVDLDDKSVRGGSFYRTMLGLNWWATARWKFGVNWGHTWLDRSGLDGESDTVMTRVQWVF